MTVLTLIGLVAVRQQVVGASRNNGCRGQHLLTFRPFADLPPAIQRAYLAGKVHLLHTPRRWTSLGIGLVGALIGGAIFRLFGIWPALDAFAISLRDVVAAFVGSLISLLCFGSLGATEGPRRAARA
jgi:hypothetical protein